MSRSGGRFADGVFAASVETLAMLRDAIGAVIERASGQSYHDFFQTRVFDRLGIAPLDSAMPVGHDSQYLQHPD